MQYNALHVTVRSSNIHHIIQIMYDMLDEERGVNGEGSPLVMILENMKICMTTQPRDEKSMCDVLDPKMTQADQALVVKRRQI